MGDNLGNTVGIWDGILLRNLNGKEGRRMCEELGVDTEGIRLDILEVEHYEVGKDSLENLELNADKMRNCRSFSSLDFRRIFVLAREDSHLGISLVICICCNLLKIREEGDQLVDERSQIHEKGILAGSSFHILRNGHIWNFVLCDARTCLAYEVVLHRNT